MKNDQYVCITCGNIIQAMQGSSKPTYCPLCNNDIFQLVSNEQNPLYRFMVPWDISEYNNNQKKSSSIFKEHSKIIDRKSNEIGYY